MKKLIILCIFLFLGIIDVHALTLNQNVDYSGYYVEINNEIHELFYIRGRRNQLYFSLQYDEEIFNYSYSDTYGEEGLLSERLLQDINDAIFYGYINGKYYDMNYLITQVLIYKMYYGYDNVHLLDNNSNILYEEEMKKIVEGFIYDKLIETNMELYQTLNLPDDRYSYDLSRLDNTKLGDYEVFYYDDLDYHYYYNEVNSIFDANMERVIHDSYTVHVNGLPVRFINKSNCQNFEVYQNGKLLTTFTNENPITNLNKRKTYVIKSGTAEVSFYIDFYDTEELVIIFDQDDENLKHPVENDNVISNNPVEEENKENTESQEKITPDIVLNSEENSQGIIPNNKFYDYKLPVNPKTGYNISNVIIIFVIISIIYVILFVNYLKNQNK